MEQDIKELIRLTSLNTLYTGSGSLLALLALIIAVIAFLK